jgi:hypothetical protein
MANEAYITNGTKKLINGEASADVAFSVEGLANSAGRVAAQLDLLAAPRPYRFKWTAECQWQATPTQGGVLELYIATAPDWDAAKITGDVGNADAALGDVDMRRNLQYIGCIVSENAAASEVCRAGGEFTCVHRYISVVAYNAGGAAINATDSNFKFELQPFYDQGQ